MASHSSKYRVETRTAKEEIACYAGELLHRMISAYILNKRQLVKKLWVEWNRDPLLYNKLWFTTRLANMASFLRDVDYDQILSEVSVEVNYTMASGKRSTFKGIIDCILLNSRTNEVCIVEWKSTLASASPLHEEQLQGYGQMVEINYLETPKLLLVYLDKGRVIQVENKSVIKDPWISVDNNPILMFLQKTDIVLDD